MPGARLRVRSASLSVVLQHSQAWDKAGDHGGSAEAGGWPDADSGVRGPGLHVVGRTEPVCAAHRTRWRPRAARRRPSSSPSAPATARTGSTCGRLAASCGWRSGTRCNAGSTRTGPGPRPDRSSRCWTTWPQGAESLLERPLTTGWPDCRPRRRCTRPARSWATRSSACSTCVTGPAGTANTSVTCGGCAGSASPATRGQPGFHCGATTWLRELAKRWCRWRMSCGVGLGQLRKDRIALVRLSQLTPGLASSTARTRSTARRWRATWPTGRRDPAPEDPQRRYRRV